MTHSVTIRFVAPASHRHSLPLVWFDRPVKNAAAVCVLAWTNLALHLLPSDDAALDGYTKWLQVSGHPPYLDLSTLHDTPASLTYAD